MMIQTGDKASLKRTFSEQDVVDFAGLSLDHNPVHLDEGFAGQTIFRQRIVHGFLYSSLISAVIGTQLPGPGSIYMSQSMKFLRPVYIGEEVEAQVSVLEIDESKKRVRLETLCIKQNGEVVVQGEALIRLP